MSPTESTAWSRLRQKTPTEEMRPVFEEVLNTYLAQDSRFKAASFPSLASSSSKKIFIIGLTSGKQSRPTFPQANAIQKPSRYCSLFKLKANCVRIMYLVHNGGRIYTQVIQDLSQTKSARTEQIQISIALHVKLGSLIGWSVKPDAAASSEQ